MLYYHACQVFSSFSNRSIISSVAQSQSAFDGLSNMKTEIPQRKSSTAIRTAFDLPFLTRKDKLSQERFEIAIYLTSLQVLDESLLILDCIIVAIDKVPDLSNRCFLIIVAISI